MLEEQTKIRHRIIYLQSWLNHDTDNASIYEELGQLYRKLSLLEGRQT